MYRRFLVVLIAMGAVAVPPSILAEIADDEKMAREALAPYVRGRPGEIAYESKIERLRQQVDERAFREPEQLLSGTLVFASGKSVGELAALAGRHKLEVVSIHIKTPYNDRGAVQSIDIGAADLARYKGGIAARAKRATGAMRYKFLEWSAALPEDEAEFHRQVAYSPMLIYRCEVYGTASALHQVSQNEDNVAAIVLDRSDRSEAQIKMHKELMKRSKQAWEQFDSQRSSS